jgi:hypothetical protein
VRKVTKLRVEHSMLYLSFDRRLLVMVQSKQKNCEIRIATHPDDVFRFEHVAHRPRLHIATGNVSASSSSFSGISSTAKANSFIATGCNLITRQPSLAKLLQDAVA